MALVPAPGGGGTHTIWVSLFAETAGVIVLAIFADMNDDLGKIAVVLIAGWFLIFLMINAPSLSALVSKV